MDSKRSAAAPEYLDENWGHWIFVFDRGRFAITQENAEVLHVGVRDLRGRRRRDDLAVHRRRRPGAERRAEQAGRGVLLQRERLPRHRLARPRDRRDFAGELQRQAVAADRLTVTSEAEPALPAAGARRCRDDVWAAGRARPRVELAWWSRPGSRARSLRA